ncbi:MAG: hypothetical protein ABIH55_01140 [Nanoarchaeota archaeon]|nr:hypothetical protein [Nanoarchaeota archaeon]
MKKKAQTEIVIVVVLIAAVIFAGYLVYQALLSDGDFAIGLSQTQQTVNKGVTSLIEAEFTDVLKEFYSTGGVTQEEIELKDDFTNEYATFVDQRVVYWQKCENDVSPELDIIKTSMEEAFKSRLNERLETIIPTFSKKVEFPEGVKSVSLNILDNKIDITVDLPTVIEDETMETYKKSVNTELGKIIKFSKAFVEENARERYFENYVFYSMILSLYDRPENFVPIHPAQLPAESTYIFKHFLETSDSIANHIDFVSKKIRFWTHSSGDMDLPILNLGGVPYPEFNARNVPASERNVVFETMDVIQYKGFDRFSVLNFKSTPSVVVIMPKNIDFGGGTTIDLDNFPWPTYEFQFPVVARVKDKYINKYFNFAILSYVDMAYYSSTGEEHADSIDIEGDCRSFSISTDCSYSDNDITIRVTDQNSDAVPYTYVTINGCPLMKHGEISLETNTEGEVYGYSPIGNIRIEQPGYITYEEYFDPSTDVVHEIILTKNPVLSFNFKELGIGKYYKGDTECISEYNYIVSGSNAITEIDNDADYFVYIIFTDNDGNEFTVSNKQFINGNDLILSQVEVRTLPSGTYEAELYTIDYNENKIACDGLVESVDSGIFNVIEINTNDCDFIESLNDVTDVLFKSRNENSFYGGKDTWDFESRVIKTEIDGDIVKLYLERSPQSGSIIYVKRYDQFVVGPINDNFMHINFDVTVPSSDGDANVYIPMLKATDDLQWRLFNYIDYEQQQKIINGLLFGNTPDPNNAVDTCGFDSIILFDSGLPTEMLDGCLVSGEVDKINYGEQCWVTHYEMSGKNCGKQSCHNYIACCAGDSYAADLTECQSQWAGECPDYGN